MKHHMPGTLTASIKQWEFWLCLCPTSDLSGKEILKCVSSSLHSPSTTSTGFQSVSSTEHLAQYLARCDLVSSSLYQFDDKPEHAWQSSYYNMTEGLTTAEELDFMTKWLVRESSNRVKRIRSVHITNPDIALKEVWERLKECYAAPKIIESLFRRLENFPQKSIATSQRSPTGIPHTALNL